MTLRVVFMGTPDFSVPALEALLNAGHDIAAVYSQPPRRSGRGMKETPSPVHRRAAAAGIPVFTPTSLKPDDIVETFRGHNADIAVVVAYGMLLPDAILSAPRHGCLNIHASLLPRWRGAAPIHRAILAGDTETGISIMKMDTGLDTGPVALTETLAIEADDTVGSLHDRLASLGGWLIVSALDALEDGSLRFIDQPAEGVTYASKIDKAEARIDWSRSSTDVHNQIRGLSPFPGAWCTMPFGDRTERVKLLAAERADGMHSDNEIPPGTVLDDALTIACGSGAIRPTLLQRAGKQALDRAAFLRGHTIPVHTRLDQS